MQSQFADAVSTNPMNAMTEITRRNLEAWSAVQESLLEAAGMKGPGDKKK